MELSLTNVAWFLFEIFFISNQTKMIKWYSCIHTRWSISFFYTLTGWFDNNNVCMKKNMVDIFSVYPDILFDNKKSEKIAEISFHNRNNRNYDNNRNIQEKMFKMDSFWIGHKACLLFCYLRHISLQNEMTNIDRF